MITINLKQKTNKVGHLVIDVPTSLINKNVEVVLIIQENEDTASKNMKKETPKKKYDFSHLYGKLQWKGNALTEQKKIRSEWK